MRKQLISFVLITAVMAIVFYLFPSAADAVYAEQFFPLFSKVVRWFTSSTSIPLIVPVIMLIPGLIFLLFTYSNGIFSFVKNSLLAIAVAASLFLWSWGFFYFTTGLHHRAQAPEVSNEQLAAWGKKIAISIERPSELEQVNEDSIAQWVGDYLGEKNKAFSPKETARCKAFDDHYFLKKIGIGGIYMPFTAEAYTSKYQGEFSLAFVQAHELSHAFGISNEGEADYVAFRALMRSNNAQAHYAAQLELLRTIRSILRFSDEKLWEEVVRATPFAVNTDLVYLRFQNSLHPEYFKGLGSQINNQYLHVMGVQGGVASYDEMVNWIYAEDEAANESN